jgi:hypothetical protein
MKLACAPVFGTKIMEKIKLKFLSWPSLLTSWRQTKTYSLESMPL